MEPLNVLIWCGIVLAAAATLTYIGYGVLLVLIYVDHVRERKRRKAASTAPTGNYLTLHPTSFEKLAKIYGWDVSDNDQPHP